MADLSDVETAIVGLIGAAIYPGGIGQPSALAGATPVKIYRGWPIPATLDADLVAGTVNVSVFPMPGTAVGVFQVLDNTYTITPVSYGMSVGVVGNVITVSGQPNAGEFLTLLCDGNLIYSRTGANTAALLAALATDAQVNFPSASSTANTLTVPVGHSLVVRQGGKATLGKVLHRQKHAVMVSTWAPTDAARIAVASLIDVTLKGHIILTMPDTSQAAMCYSRTNVTDDKQKAAIYRRDLIYDVEYATVQQFPGFVITSVSDTITTIGNGSAVVTAIN